MSSSPSSPKRRRVLSSLNPAPPAPLARSPDKSDDALPRAAVAPSPEPVRAEHRDEDDPLRPRRSRLKLKPCSRRRHRSPRTRSPRRDGDSEDEAGHDRRHGRHRRRSRRRRRRTSTSRGSPELPGPPPLDAETAFRESLFDAMADDEAASYWEHVYGQPIHVYSNEKAGPQGELERMTDDEYAAYVRQKMFEKTHAGLLEERARREEESRRRDRERREHAEQSRRARKLQSDVEQSLRRGEARRQRRQWASLWADYTDGWAAWQGDAAKLPWPVAGGRPQDIKEDDVRAFFVHGLNLDEVGERTFAAQLKEERIRWHPDKIQQRLGGVVDGEVMRNVTAVFQIIDRLWGQTRP